MVGEEGVPALLIAAAAEQRRPVEHLEVDLEARVLQVLLGHEAHLVQEVVLLGRHDADRLLAVARLLQPRVEAARQGGIEQHHRLRQRHAGLGAADDQDVDPQRRQRPDVEAGGRRIGQPRPVQVHGQAARLGLGGQRPDRAGRVDGAVLGGVGERERRGRLAVAGLRPLQRGLEGGGVDAAGRAGQRDQPQAVAEEARRARLVGLDVGVAVGQHRRERPAQGGAGQGVGRRARGDESHVRVRVQETPHGVGRLGRHVVGAVAGGEARVGGHQRLHRLGRGAGGVVGGEVVAGHGRFPAARPGG